MSKAIWKKGLGLRLVALAALVAVIAVGALVATPSVKATVETRTVIDNDDDTFAPAAATATYKNGDTVYITNSGTGFVQFEIATTGDASASFTHGSATDADQQILCSPYVTPEGSPTDAEVAAAKRRACDVDVTSSGEGVTVALKIDNDSGAGVVFVKQTRITGTGITAENRVTTDAVKVDVKPVPTRISIDASSKSIAAANGNSVLTFQVQDAKGDNIAASKVTLITNNGTLDAAMTLVPDTDDDGEPEATPVSPDPCTGDQSCTVTTGTAGANVTLTGSDRAGIATVTLISGDLTTTIDIVMYGPVASISAAAEQGSIEVGGMTFIVVTAVDSGGNPVADATVDLDTDSDNGGIAGPAERANKVIVNSNRDKDVNRDRAVDKGDITGCQDQNADAHATGGDDGDEPTNLQAGNPLADIDAGTNADGQCVIMVSSTNNDTPDTKDDTSRGTHTITLKADALDEDSDKVSVAIQVGGPATSIESDAPVSINPSDELTVNVTVLDDQGVRVGEVTIEVIQTAGSGKVITDAASDTSDGRASFTYLAPSTSGVVEFLVRTKDASTPPKVTAQLPIIITIGDPEPEEPPAPVESAVSLDLSEGGDYYSISDNSVPTTASALFDGTSVSVAWKWDRASSSWTSYIPAIGSTDFLVTSGDILWIVAGSAETVGG